VKLNVLKRNQPNQVIDLGKDVLAQDYSETIFLIGRSKECHVVLDDKKISREHVRIIHKNAKWFLEKCNEENQCKINGDDFTRHEIESGDVLTIEQFSINFEESTGEAQGILVDSIEQKKIQSSDLSPINTTQEIIETKESQVQDHQSEKKSNATATDLSIAQLTTKDYGDSTREINLDEMMKSNANSEYASEPDDDFEIDGTGTSSSIENQDTDAEIIISAADDSQNEEGENSSYSLENIDGGGNDEHTRVMQSFATVHLELFGETAPYDKFIIEKDKTFIGRDPSKCQIVLNDSDVSTVHAVIVRNNIMLTLEDLNSSNGTIYKGDRINKVILGHNDEFVIGGVSFTVKIRSEFLKDESATLMAVDENQTVEVEEVVEVQAEEGEQLDALGEMVENQPQEKSIIKRILKDEAQRKKLLYGVVLLVGAWLFLGDEEQKAPEPKKTNVASTRGKTKKKINKTASGKKLSEDQMRSLSATYEIGKGHFNNGRYREALSELQKIVVIDPNFNPNLQSLISLSKEGLSKIEEAEKERQAKIQAAERKAKVTSLLEKAKEYTKDRRVDIATATFNEITQLDPENFEVSRMKRELEDWQKEKQRKELEEVQKKKDREDKVEKLKPSRTLFLQNEWFKTINKLEEFLKIKEMDDDLTTEATTMLKKAKEELTASVSPLQGKAKSLLEGQDLKGAYEVYQQILKIEPSNSEALNQIGDIKEQLTNRARKIYREAIISESLSLFQDAKEKFQEVQQISPVDSEYYKKASDKLKDYLE
jgi:pSer/pThr/pTyr-binding forkhead associated (FHA) protein/tetratricopeptide (TPR) repeat protein